MLILRAANVVATAGKSYLTFPRPKPLSAPEKLQIEYRGTSPQHIPDRRRRWHFRRGCGLGSADERTYGNHQGCADRGRVFACMVWFAPLAEKNPKQAELRPYAAAMSITQARRNSGLFFDKHALQMVTQSLNKRNRQAVRPSLECNCCFSIPRWQCLTLPDPSQ